MPLDFRQAGPDELEAAVRLLLTSPAGAPEAAQVAGFSHVADLVYLQGKPRARVAVPPPGFAWLQFTDNDPGSYRLFADAILGSYERSLDCPALNGKRSIDDIMTGHRATGQFDPR